MSLFECQWIITQRFVFLFYSFIRGVIENFISFLSLSLSMGGFAPYFVIINSNLSQSDEKVKKQNMANLWRQHSVNDVMCWRRRCENARRWTRAVFFTWLWMPYYQRESSFNPILSLRFGHEIKLYDHSHPFADSRRAVVSYWTLSTGKLLRRLAREQGGWVNWLRPK